jgi:hypothetical protein
MKLVILRSKTLNACEPPDQTYVQHFDTRYAERVLGNLANEPGFCTACDGKCVACRKEYARLDHSFHLEAIVDLPSALPHVLERPQEHLPHNIPQHDILLCIDVHEQILLEMLTKCVSFGTKGVIVPLEHADWLSGSAKAAASRVCESAGIEIAFPKPFCAFRPPRGSILDEFRRSSRIGYPEVTFEVRNNTITDARVEVSAACGATYFVAQALIGKRLEPSLRTEVISRALHSYPCTASMEMDPEIGDTPLHVAGQAHYALLNPWEHFLAESEPTQPENVVNIQKAEEAVLKAIEDGQVALSGLMARPDLLPAAVSSALIRLKKKGLIKVNSRTVFRAH